MSGQRARSEETLVPHITHNRTKHRAGRWGEVWDVTTGQWVIIGGEVTKREMLEQRIRASRAYPFVSWERWESAVPGDLTKGACNQCGELFATWECVPGGSYRDYDMANIEHHLVGKIFGYTFYYCPIADGPQGPLWGNWKIVKGFELRKVSPPMDGTS